MAARKKTSRNRVLLLAVVLVLTACGFLGGAVFWAGNAAEAKLRSLPYNLEEAKRLGMPTELSQLQVQIKYPEEDALPHLRNAYNLWTSLDGEDQNQIRFLALRVLRGRGTPPDCERLARLLKGHQALGSELLLAANKSACSVNPVETWRDPALYKFWWFVRESVRLFASEAVARAQEHDLVGAERWLTHAAALSAHLTAQTSYITVCRRAAADVEIERAIERICFAAPADRAQLADFIDRMTDRMGPMISAADALKAEPALMLDSLGDEKKNGLANVPAGSFFADVGKSGALEIWLRYFKKLPEDPEDLNGTEKVLLAMDDEGRETPFYGQFVRGYQGIIPLLRDQLARRRLTEVAAKYLRGAPLEDLPEDPHTGQPLIIKRKSNAVILYSAGRDGQDNGGAERQIGKGASPYYDLIFRLPVQ